MTLLAPTHRCAHIGRHRHTPRHCWETFGTQRRPYSDIMGLQAQNLDLVALRTSEWFRAVFSCALRAHADAMKSRRAHGQQLDP